MTRLRTRLFGEDGTDVLEGGHDRLADTLDGGSGRDTYVRDLFGDTNLEHYIGFKRGTDVEL